MNERLLEPIGTWNAAADIAQRLPGRRSILFAHGVEVVPIKTATLPPADHTNAYLVGDPDGEFVLVDPAVRMREDMEALATAVQRHRGELVAVMFTHSHSDHLADMSLLREAFDVPVWGSEHTALSVPCDRILQDGDVLALGEQSWTVLITPGHHPGHVCLFSDAGLVAGDMLAGIGTILIPPHSGDMNEYIVQLERLKALKPHLVFPSHGPVVAVPDKLIDHYLKHRRARHARVLAAVQGGTSDLSSIAVEAYADTPDAHPGLAVDQTLSPPRPPGRWGGAPNQRDVERGGMTTGLRVIITKAGDVSAITTEPMHAVEPAEGEVRIKVAYAGINFADLLMRLGFYQPRPPFPFTPRIRGFGRGGCARQRCVGPRGWAAGRRSNANGRPSQFCQRSRGPRFHCPTGFPCRKRPQRR